ncbi:pseudouridine synthase [Adhaeribacter radiodurans]|uniref:Pseudouridine synthase n=1 Tax=Adhaeribacter radiodurans TaxID=2745197 RepID=A0A7L7L6D1_9BACT|nr:pseudouridine synthase [Adhaeribacter radiodurans]QMU28065.1 pseudouridine synthase [Adhaeribacter radiodurans]
MKNLTASLKHFIVQKLRISNQQALDYILSGRVQVNGKKGALQQALLPEDEVTFEEQVLKQPTAYLYLAYYKPRGIESTLNPAIQNNLGAALPFEQRVFPVGRLDKESEGLMLLTNNGKIYDRIIHAESHQEKEYRVTVNKPLTSAALEQLTAGITIMGKKTRPARVQPIDDNTFSIILTQGLNRQIRRMCYKLHYEVQQLVRVRMINIHLGQLKPGEWRFLSPPEIQDLNQTK